MSCLSRSLGLVLIACCSIGVVLPASAPRSRADTVSDTPEQLALSIVARMTPEEKLPQLLNVAPAIPRLNIPAYNWWTESLHGALGPVATTNFPEPIALGATFDASLVHDIAAAVGEELRALHSLGRETGHLGRIGTGLDTWSPNINIFRDPRWGRGQETYGEDPYLTASMGVAFITGMQGPDPARPLIIATPKHFAVHSGPETTRHTADVTVSAHDLEDTYLPAFRAAIVDAHAGSIMCAYNSINGQPACANDLLLRQRLRTDWGFKGYVVSDCDALRDISEGHQFVKDEATAVATAFKTGVTNECNTQLLQDLDTPLARYQEAVARGLLPQDVIDGALVRLFAARYRNGDLAGSAGGARPPLDPQPLLSDAHQALALRSAEEGMVLLKNDGALPLKRDSHLLVIGPLADGTRVLRGNYSSPLTGTPVSVLAGLRQALPSASIRYSPSPPSVTDGDPVPTAELQTASGEAGIQVEYFNARGTAPSRFSSYEDFKRRSHEFDYESSPVVTQVQPSVSSAAQALSQVHEYYKARWRGYLVPKQSGRYRLALGATTGTLTFAGKPLAVLDDVPWGTMPTYHSLDLQAGTRYPIEIEARGTPQFEIQLLWKRVATEQSTDLRSEAAGVDAIIAVVGLTSDLEGEESKVDLPGFSGGDRTTLALPVDQQRLLEAARATGKPLIVVVLNGSAVDLSWAKTHAAAILEAWYPGEAGGLAAARILAGSINPSGRLPITFYKDVAQLPPFGDYSMQNRTYRYYTGQPVFPFGYGLSYTRFTYRNVQASRLRPTGDSILKVTAQVRNAGASAGDEVTQLYLRFPKLPGVPNIALRGYQRVSLAPNEEKTVVFALSRRDLSSVSTEGIRRIVAGQYEVIVGSGLPNSGVSTAQAAFEEPTTEPLPF